MYYCNIFIFTQKKLCFFQKYGIVEKEYSKGVRMFSFIKEVFQKHRLGVLQTRQEQPTSVNDALGDELLLHKIAPTLQPRVLYTFTDSFLRSYYFLLLPDSDNELLRIGPYLKNALSPEHILEICEEKDIPPQQHKHLVEYYASLPILQENDALQTILHLFCERIWNTPSFLVLELTGKYVDAPFTKSTADDENETSILKTAIERRYAFENEMIRAVTLGQPHMEKQFRSAFSENFFEMRANTPLRNAKNYAIIMNTLLRKAAETGGVHPLYLDRISSGYANKIENLSSLTENAALMSEMFREYCRLVRKHALRKYSPVVQKTILTIDADLSVDLSPKRLAEKQSVTLGYLSAVFKKETGKTLSEYIRTRRMEYAEYLLKTTSLQVQTVALHCGIMDAQYFSKLFKAHHGKTPAEYRKTP